MDTLNSRQKGFSLVELMVALAISLFIIAGLFYSVIGDMKAYDSTRSTQGLATKSRMSIQYMKLYLQQAGFRNLEDLQNNNVFSDDTPWIQGQILRGFNNVSSGTVTGIEDPKMGSDIAVIRYLGDTTGIFSCDGSEVTSQDEQVMTLYVNTNSELICIDGAVGAEAEILDENIDNLRLLYGISEDASYQYFTATQIDSANNWNIVNRVKVGLLVSQNVRGNHLENEQRYRLFDREISAANDTNYRKAITETVLIRNKGS